MKKEEPDPVDSDVAARTIGLVGFWSAICLVIITFFTFSLAIFAVPISGSNCFEPCIKYPYLDSINQFPKDYRWMVPAIILVITYLVFMVALHSFGGETKKIFSQIGLSFALMSALIL